MSTTIKRRVSAAGDVTKCIFRHSEIIKGWAVWFHVPYEHRLGNQDFLYSKTFKTRKLAREYWSYKTGRNPKYHVVRVVEKSANIVWLAQTMRRSKPKDKS